ncbi:MAG: peptide deformylase [Myxococcales bacterium]|nr:peptide deformylase [Myxococcales bacterium]
MAVRPIVVWPDSRLREEAKTVETITDEVRSLYKDLWDTMVAYQGIGIASPQIGVAVKMFLIDAMVATGEDGAPPVAFINPEVIATGTETDKSDEGCLSFPGIYVPIERPAEATIRAMGLDCEMFEIAGTELLARAIQHENDHLTGKLMVDFVGPLKKRMIKRKLARESDYEGAEAEG